MKTWIVLILLLWAVPGCTEEFNVEEFLQEREDSRNTFTVCNYDNTEQHSYNRRNFPGKIEGDDRWYVCGRTNYICAYTDKENNLYVYGIDPDVLYDCPFSYEEAVKRAFWEHTAATLWIEQVD